MIKNMTNNIKKIIFLFAMFSACSVFAVYDDLSDLYQVEVIFFAHTNPNRFSVEKWPKFVGKLDTRSAIFLASDLSIAPISISLIDSKQWLLNDQARTIQKSKDYQFIQHIAWAQPVINRSIPIYIQAGKKSELDALVDVKYAGRNQFLVNVDMLFNTDNKEFRITRDVKVKSKEVYYIDHPILSAMVIVSPVVNAVN